MATKQQAIKALQLKAPGATLIDESTPGYYVVQLEAPTGKHWGCAVHAQPVVWFEGGNKPEYWAEVIDEINQLEPPTDCHDQADPCEGVISFGECEYWD